MVASDKAGEIGLYLLLAQNAILWELHCSVFPEALGPRGQAAGRALMPWAFEQTGAKRLVAAIPASNRLAVRYAKQCGLTQYGINPKSIERGGVLEDLILLGISPKEI